MNAMNTANTIKLALILPTFNFKTMVRVGRLVIVQIDHIKKVNCMNKQELIQAVAEKSGLTQKDAKTALDATLAVITSTLAKGDEINLVGFGSFTVKTQKARTGRNPQTGEKLTISAKKVPSFKAGKGLKDAVN